ncbi:MAG: AAA family ATPase [Succinimonas sp.]|nr:AAA family ATPase [Succinimonas sp.]
MHENRYLRRIIDGAAEFALKSRGALVISGPKWCGKSTTAKRYAKTVINLLLPDTRNEFIELARISPTHFLNYGPKPLLVNEWQHVPFIWDQVKYEVDKTGEFGQYLLTGSVTDKLGTDAGNENGRHPGNGRIIRKMMRTMSLYETATAPCPSLI